jgi:hypothetical protein
MKFYKVTSTSPDGVKSTELYYGESPKDALMRFKKYNPKAIRIRVGKTAYDTFGDKLKNKVIS